MRNTTLRLVPKFNPSEMMEVTHVADVDGEKCADCGVTICGENASPYYPYEHVTVLGRDANASWRTTREITCIGRLSRPRSTDSLQRRVEAD